MLKIKFYYHISPKTVLKDNLHNLVQYTQSDLEKIAFGNVFVFTEPKKQYFTLEISLFEYLEDIRLLIYEIDIRNKTESSSIGRDFFSNHIKYELLRDGTLCIEEGNSNSFTMQIDYITFKKAYWDFRKKVLGDMLLYYPKLKDNKVFEDWKQFKTR